MPATRGARGIIVTGRAHGALLALNHGQKKLPLRLGVRRGSFGYG